MQKYILLTMLSALLTASAVHSATVMIDPADQESPEVGETVTVGVNAVNVTGLYAYQFDVAFDKTALKFTDIAVGEFLGNDEAETLTCLKAGDQQVCFDIPADMLELLKLSGQTVETDVTPEITSQVNSAGMLTVVGTRLGSDTNIDGTGILINITFEVLAIKDSTVEIQNVELGTSISESEAQFIFDEATDTVENGMVIAPDIKGDVNEDKMVGSDDAILVLQMLVGLVTPNEYQEWAADMNDDGKLAADDVILILRRSVGMAAPVLSLGTADKSVALSYLS
ncbi:cohesin domain-containing protein [Candidatus Poribacteria bacterium]